MSDKLFVLKIREQNGEQEYTENIYTIAPDEEVAKKWAREYVKRLYGDDENECRVIDKNGEEDSLWWTYESCGGACNRISPTRNPCPLNIPNCVF